MCEFCKQINDKGETNNLISFDDTTVTIVLAKHSINNKITIEVEYSDNGEEYWASSIGFSYCPFCGKKIGE